MINKMMYNANMKSEQSLSITEVFQSIQGEGLKIGEISLFIRFSGCNLNCSFCDTPQRNTIQEIISPKNLYKKYKIKEFNNIIFTGGEPLIQDEQELVKLVKLIIKGNPYAIITIETNGTISIKKLFKFKKNIFWSISPKLWKGIDYKILTNYRCLTECSKKQYKFVIESKSQLILIKQFISYCMGGQVILQPEYNSVSVKQLIDWIAEDKILKRNVRIIPQVHKLIKVR